MGSAHMSREGLGVGKEIVMVVRVDQLSVPWVVATERDGEGRRVVMIREDQDGLLRLYRHAEQTLAG